MSTLLELVNPYWPEATKSLVPSLIAAFATWYVARKQFRADAERKRTQDMHDLTTGAADVANAYTNRFEKLLDAAEDRIDDLLREIVSLRRDVGELQQALHFRAAVCGDCPHFPQTIQLSGGTNVN